MKIAITTEEKSLESMLDTRFGRAGQFILYETDDDSWEVLDNTQNLQAAQGAGIQAAQNIVQAGAQALITGHTGPKAWHVLLKAGIPIYYSPRKPVKELIAAFKNGTLEKATGADVDSHWV